MTSKAGPSSAFAWLVHFYTATGAVLAFAAVLATFEGRFRMAFVLLIAATIVDASDGVLARLARVKELAAGVDGARLDDIVDYLTFVFVPMLILFRAGHLPDGWGLGIAGAVLLSSAYGFASLDAKTDDYFFTGFPSYWNIVALYIHAARTPPLFNAALLMVLVALVFVRIGYVYPSRTPVLQRTTIALGMIWAAMMVVIVYLLPDVPRGLVVASLFFPSYYAVLSLWLNARRRRGGSRTTFGQPSERSGVGVGTHVAQRARRGAGDPADK